MAVRAPQAGGNRRIHMQVTNRSHARRRENWLNPFRRHSGRTPGSTGAGKVMTEERLKELRKLASREMQDALAEVDRLRAELKAREEAIDAAKTALTNLRSYEAVEGRPDGEKLLVGLAYDSVWGPCADPEYEMYELAETIANWLHD